MDDAPHPDDDVTAWIEGRRALRSAPDTWPPPLSASPPAGTREWQQIQRAALGQCSAADDRALEFAVAALTVHDSPAPIARAIEAALLADVLLG